MIEIRKCGLMLLKILPNEGKGENGKYRATMGIYKCVCGNIKELKITEVKSGHTKSCGCYKRVQNGLSGHPLYSVWNDMIDRCYDIGHHAYPLYGLIGIEVCDEWKNNFISFYNWCMANGWKKKMVIDKDVKAMAIGTKPKLYSPDWCSIITQRQNSNSKSNNVFIEYNGKKQTLAQWGQELGIPKPTLHHRLRDFGYTVEEAFSKNNFRLHKRKKSA